MNSKIQDLILNAFESFNNRIAIKQGTESYSFGDVKRRAIAISNYLLKNVSQEYVAVLCDDKFNTICSMLGILLSRKAFVMVEKRFPDKRKQKMLDLLKCTYIITDSPSLIIKDSNYQYIDVDQVYSSEVGASIHLKYSDEDPIYVFFTSGTTGEPKAVVGKNKSLVHFILWEIETFNISSKDSFAQFTSISHDPFLRDIFVPFIVGGIICIPENEYIFFDNKKTVEFINENQVTHIHCTPSMFKMMTSYHYTDTDFKSLNYIFFAGEELKAHELKDFYELYKDRVTFVNLYGPTETTMAKLYHVISDNDIENGLIPLGEPITHTIVSVMRNESEEANVGEEGELYIYTEYGTFGYTDLDYTKKKYVVLDGKTYYKTGDMGKRGVNGKIIFCGRKDNQIKIRGNRIDTSEIEKTLLEIKQVKEALVLAKINEITKEPYLCAYCNLKEEADVIDIKASLYKLLPDYMVPSKILLVEHFPLNINGKIDFKELEKCVIHEDLKESSELITDSNMLLIKKIWDELLGDNGVNYSVEDDLFLIGGDSFNVFEFINILRKEHNLEVQPRDVFELRTIKEISKKVKQVDENQSMKHTCKDINGEIFKILPVQRQIYDLDIRFKGTKFISWNMARIYKMTKDIPLQSIEKYLNFIVERHNILRSYFEVNDSGVVRRVKEKLHIEISSYRATCSDEELIGFIKSLTRKFELNNPPLLEAFIVNHKNSTFFCINMHHIISDEKTFGLIIEEMTMLCNGMNLPSEVSQYNDFIMLREAKANKDLKFWLQKLHKAGNIKFPNSKSTWNVEAGNVHFAINMLDLKNNLGLTRYMMCIAALTLLIRIETGEKNVGFLTFHDLRASYNFRNVLGLFTHNAIILHEFHDDVTVEDYLLSVRNNIIETYEFQDYYYENLVEHRKQSGIYEHNVLLNYQIENTSDKVAPIFEKVTYDEEICNLDLIWEITETIESINITIRYKRKMFSEEFIEKLSKQYQKIIGSLITCKTCPLDEYIANFIG